MKKIAPVLIVILAAFLIISCPGVGEDPAGETSESDTGLPVITLLGDNPFTTEINEDYVEPGYSASDDEDGNLTTEVEIAGTVDTSTVGIYTLNYNVSDTSGNEAPQVTRVIYVENSAATLDDVRVNITVNFEYTGSGAADRMGAVILTPVDGGAAFAGFSFYYNDFTTDYIGSVTFDDPLVPFIDYVYAEIYFDSDHSFNMTTGDSHYQDSTPIPVDGGSIDITFNDTQSIAAGILEINGGWEAELSGDDTPLLYNFVNDTFSILVSDYIDPTYADLASTNSYGVITVINNSEKYLIGKWAYHPEGNAYVGKYMKVTWKDSDGIILDDMYWPYDTEQEAINASTGETSFSSPAQIF